MAERVERTFFSGNTHDGQKALRRDRMTLFQPIMRLKEGWYKGKKTGFTIGISREEIDPGWCMSLVHPKYTPEIWLQTRKNLYTLRVPKRFGTRVKRKLRFIGLRYSAEKRSWIGGKFFKLGTGRIYGEKRIRWSERKH